MEFATGVSLPFELSAQRSWQLHGMAPERAGQVRADIPCIPCANPRGQQKVSHSNQGEEAQSKHRARPQPLTSLPPKKKGKKLEFRLPYIATLQTSCPHACCSWPSPGRRELHNARRVGSMTFGGHSRLPFMFSLVCPGQQEEGILYPENTQLF